MVEAQGQVAKRIDRYWLRPHLALPKPAGGETTRRVCELALPTGVPLQELDPARGQRAFSYKTSTDLLHW